MKGANVSEAGEGARGPRKALEWGSGMLVSAAEGDEVVEGEAVVFCWKHEHEKQ